jgi:solute carrier family 13 (sodium-dependent dicarboxylate transporter), member 2/3/5
MAEVESIKKEATTKSIIIKSLIALGLGILVMMLPRPENLTPEGHRLLALLTTIVILWVTEAVPIGVTALLAGAGLILLKDSKLPECLGTICQPGGHVRAHDHYVRGGVE